MRKYRHGKILKTVIEHAESPDGGDEKNADEAENDGEGVEDTDEEVLEDSGTVEIEGHGCGCGSRKGRKGKERKGKERGNRGRDGARRGSRGISLVDMLVSRGKDAKLHVRDCEKECAA